MFVFAVLVLLGLQTHLFRYCYGLTLSPSGMDNTLEVVQKKGDNLFTCNGLTANDTVQWILRASAQGNHNAASDAGTCLPSPAYTCTVTIDPVFTPGRVEASTSTMTVNATESRYNVFFQGTSIQCRALYNNTEKESKTSYLDHIAKPTSSVCNILVNASVVSSEWTLTANCTVTGVYSYRDRYTCQLVQTAPGVSNRSSTVNMTVVPSPNTIYKTGMCDVTVPFPNTSATYSYKMVVTPGRVDVVASFEGSNSFQIRRPGSPPSHTCPQYVAETQGVSCTCSATDLGQPAGVVRWSGFPSNQLSLSNVNKKQTGTQLVCEVMWNGERVQSVVYTVQVAFTTILSLTVNSVTSDSLTVNNSETVTLTCRGDGRPSPEMTLFSAAKDAVGHIPQGTPSLEDKIMEVTGNVTAQCRDTGIYTCKASNGVGEKQTRRVTVFVRCKPEVLDSKTENDGSMKTPSVDFVTKAVRLNFHVAAYPTPQLSDIKFFPQRPNATSVGKPVKGNTIQVACSRHTVDLFNVTCTVTVDNITSSDAGFYQAVIGNDLGAVKVLFQVTVNATIASPSSKFPVVAAAAGIAAAAVLVIGGIALFLVLWRRRKGKRKEECPQRSHSEDAMNKDTPGGSPDVPSNYDCLQHQDIGVRSDYSELRYCENKGKNSASGSGGSPDVPSNYESLRPQDIGVRSEYSELTHCEKKGKNSASGSGPVYANKRPLDGKVYQNAGQSSST